MWRPFVELKRGKQVSTVQWRDDDGNRQDPPDGSPAVQRFRPDGSVASEEHWQADKLQDPPDGSPAVRRFHSDGSIEWEEHYQAGQLQDPPDGSPAVRHLRPDGTVGAEGHYRAGVRVPG